MDELRSAFDATGERVVVPPGDLGAVVRKGEGRRRRRLMTAVASFAAVALAGGTLATILGGQEGRPLPATTIGADRSGTRLVPVVMRGASPFRELASPWERAEARAITVGFHAFLEGAGRRYDFDYEGFGGNDGTWWIRFAQYPPPPPLERELAEVQAALEADAERLRARLLEIDRASDRLRSELEDTARTYRRRAARLQGSLREQERRLREEMREHVREVDAVERRRVRLARRQVSYRTEVTVVERDGVLVVEDVDTDSPDAASLEGVVGYSEPVAEVDAWGADYYDATIRRRSGFDEDVAVEVFGFWTGPLYSAYEEMCRPQVLAPDGRVVWTERRVETPPGVPEPYESGPDREELRDYLLLTFGFAYDGAVDELELRMVCDWRPRQ